jgi:NTP pyrophosphatase (non-canonical NTP hydrolase)
MRLSDLRRANAQRQAEWDGDNRTNTLAYRAMELGGEVGEALNVAKKLERERLGISGSRSSLERLAAELADVMICCDLLALAAGIDLQRAVVDTFNKKSEEMSLRTRLEEP